MANLVIADDHKLFRLGLVSMMNGLPDMQVVGQAANGREALEAVHKTQPDVLLLDIEMPLMDGFEVLQKFRDYSKTTRVLVLTMHHSAEFVKNIVKAGAAGYLKKDSDPETLLSAIRSIMTVGTYYPPETAQLVLQSLQEQKSGPEVSPREKEVIKLIAEGLTTKQIADKLFLSKFTVESHRQNILLKLGLKNSAELVKYALKRGWA